MATHSPSGATTTIVVVTFQSAATIAACLDTVAHCTPEPHEVIVVDNASSDETCALVEARSVRLIRNTQNRGFSAACNQGIAAASASATTVVLLNPDTAVTQGWLGRLLAPFAEKDVAAVGPLSTYVAGMQKSWVHWPNDVPQTDDVLETARVLAERNAGRTYSSPFLVGFCVALRRELLEKHGGLDETLVLGNDDLELSHRYRQLGYRLMIALDCLVIHEGQHSFKSLPDWKREAMTLASTDALEHKLEAEYGKGKVPTSRELWGMDWFVPRTKDVVSIVIPVWNNSALTKLCLKSVAAFTTHPHEVIVVDNGSTDDTELVLADFPHVRVIRNSSNRGFAAASNQGMRAATGKHLVLLNNDVVVTPEWLEGLLDHPRLHPEIGIVGPRTNCASGPQLVPNVGYKSLDELGAYAARFRREARCQRKIFPRVTGLCMLVTEPCWKAVGLLDERFGIGNYEDDDYCVRAKLAGFECCIAGDVFVHHFGSQTFKKLDMSYAGLLETNKKKFFEKWDCLKRGEDAIRTEGAQLVKIGE